MQGIFYIRHKKGLKEIHRCTVPDNALRYKLIGTIVNKTVTNTTVIGQQQILLFNRVSVLGDEAMYVFDAYEYI